MNHLESQQKYDKKGLSTHTMHLVEIEKVYLRNEPYSSLEDVSGVRAPLSFQLNELFNKELWRVLLLACSFLALVSESGSGSIFNIDPQNSLVASGNATEAPTNLLSHPR